jgi:hypothetical protein
MHLNACNHCGSHNIYAGLSVVECATIGCKNFTQRQFNEVSSFNKEDVSYKEYARVPVPFIEVGLFTELDDGTLKEISYSNYTRAKCTLSDGLVGSNINKVIFPEVEYGHCTVTHMKIFYNGIEINSGNCDFPISLGRHIQPQISVGRLTVED